MLLGAHGAGLTHALFLPPGGGVVELQPPGFSLPHFRVYAGLTGAAYAARSVARDPPPEDVVAAVASAAAAAAARPQAEPAGLRGKWAWKPREAFHLIDSVSNA